MNAKQIIIFLGAPGSGKGALSRLCVSSFGWAQLSTGNLCRKHVAEGTELGKQIDFAMKSGTLVPDEVIIEIGTRWIDDEACKSESLILDGFPRTVVQARGVLDFLVKKYPYLRVVIIELRVPDHEIIERLSSRLICTDKSCQAVFSSRIENLMPKTQGICDLCSSVLFRREDDSSDVIRGRLATYHQHCGNLTAFYKNAGYVVHVIDGNRGSAEVFENFLRHVSD